MSRRAWLPYESQSAYRERYRAARPGWLSSGEQFDVMVKQHLTAETRVLDLGCGRSGGIERFWREARLAVGIDRDHRSLGERTQKMAVLQSGGEHLPFADAAFDMVVSVWVIEHLDAPDKVFTEVARVLKPGGHFVFLTPNAHNPLIFGNRVGQVAPWLQHRLVAGVYGRDKADTFAIHYKANTSSRLRALAAATGFGVSSIKVIADPTYVAFNAFLFHAAVLGERVLPAGLGVHLLGDLVKA